MKNSTATITTSALLLVLLVSSAAALQCYECPSCGSSVGTKTNCVSPNDACMTMSLKGHTGKACTVKFACDAISKMDMSQAWNSLKDVFSGMGPGVSADDMKSLKVDCCEGDLCNSASTSAVSPLLLLLVPTFVYLLRN